MTLILSVITRSRRNRLASTSSSNAYIVMLGSIVTLGFCKLSGKCSLDYELYEPVASFRSLVTPERLVTAERFFLKAVEKYAEERKRSIKK
ncbi:hypothetical protein JYU34_004058 [Plutella xylostella]|uniref:Uncharacterized protein n=1 Tax=Plutella xylostella TaxID=51655 RepID=A0ABQ7QX18_PLUXY|nr:hypothetical protein JYU34_004058 [Plutella xylostella]